MGALIDQHHHHNNVAIPNSSMDFSRTTKPADRLPADDTSSLSGETTKATMLPTEAGSNGTSPDSEGFEEEVETNYVR